MENCIRRFPDVVTMILNNLDDQILVRSKEISREMSEFIKKERFYWIRIIEKYNDVSSQIIKKVPIKDLKDLAIKSEKSYLIGVIEDYIDNFVGRKEAWNEVINNIPINIVKQLATALASYLFIGDIAPMKVAVKSGSLELCEYVIFKTREKNPTDFYGKTEGVSNHSNVMLNSNRFLCQN